MLKIRKVLYPSMHKVSALGRQRRTSGMPTTCLIEDRPFRTHPWCHGACCVFVLGAALSLPAQVLSPPPRLEPTAIALAEIQKCGESISKSAPDISFKLLDAQRQLAVADTSEAATTTAV